MLAAEWKHNNLGDSVCHVSNATQLTEVTGAPQIFGLAAHH